MADLYDGPIIDAHHHFWDPQRNHHPWLSGEANIPFRYGDYSAIKRRYFPDDYLADAGAHRVVATVYVETEWDPRDPIGETRFIHQVAERYGAPNAVVAQAWLDAPDAAEVLAAQAGFERVRSVRHKPGGPASPAEVGTGRSLMSDERWRRGYAELARHGLHFDLQAPWWNLPEAVELAHDFPDTQLILNHAGLPSDRSAQGLAAWHAAMAGLAACENVAVKVSGLGLPGKRWCAEDNAWIVRETLAMFGVERVMFASNFPVDSLCGSFDAIYGGFKRIVADLPRAQQEQLFHDNARRLYRTVPDVIRIPDASSDLRTTV
ncbi:Predicted metal-dependent hydrolase, TIM-barrel fold [Pseudomonas flavescens]|uniref:Predicted metal-dependent hydrolase, TIM-barrel fold n=1 Tax=Phytopseudomonas flavescens TaxID=29435 RepID=A0A1G8D0Y3_9GAMM|nr:amidohydrolase [Pseudomonas flavescens]SDH51415.1 Predicted metal-dependent hydrolase, TIM-barrel fold [Pseudomonas flavescens]